MEDFIVNQPREGLTNFPFRENALTPSLTQHTWVGRSKLILGAKATMSDLAQEEVQNSGFFLFYNMITCYKNNDQASNMDLTE